MGYWIVMARGLNDIVGIMKKRIEKKNRGCWSVVLINELGERVCCFVCDRTLDNAELLSELCAELGLDCRLGLGGVS